jgi:Domain of unknown function (DUF5013)
MENIWNKIRVILVVTGLLPLACCQVDTLKDIKGLEASVSLVQVQDGEVALKPEDVTIDKTNLLVRKTLGISYAGYQPNEAFTATVEMDLDQVPDGYEKFSAGECFINTTTDGKGSTGNVEIAAGTGHQPFYFNVTKAAIDAHATKKMAVKILLRSSSKYKLNTRADAVYLLMDLNDFGTLKVDVTASYFKNTTFNRAPGTTTRFANLADWLANDAVTKSRPDGAGFDANAGKMGIERWSSGDNPIINGKIYQTFTLPEGNYQVEVAMATVAPDRDTYFVIAAGTDLPNDTQIATAIASKLITADLNGGTLSLPFRIDTKQPVAAGFLLNFDKGVQKILQASGIKMYRIETLFD